MKYMGSKNRIAKYILPIMLKDRKKGQYWVEPFVGGANMIDKVCGNRIGADSNLYLIELLKYCSMLKSDMLPDRISEEEYNHIKNNKDEYDKHLVAFCGFNSTFGAKWFGGYARPRKNGYDRDVICGKNTLVKQGLLLQGVKFIYSNYQDLEIPDNSIIYCDPPYENTTSYKDKFSHEEFWEWCRNMSSQGHKVYISEYNAPDDFECIWHKEINVSLTKDTGNKKGIERLFTLKE